MSLPLTVFTNLFTVAGKDPSANEYIEMLGIWYMFLTSFGKLTPEDSIVVQMDEVTYNFIKNTGEVDDFLKEVTVTVFKQPEDVIDGMAARYSLAARLQEQEPGRMYLYLDLDVLVCRPLCNLYDDVMVQNRVLYTTEDKIVHYSGDILSETYLADRMSLSDQQIEDLSGTGGIGSGTFGWHHIDPDFGKFFTDIVNKINEFEEIYYTLDQPFFNEAILQKKIENEWSVYHVDSNKIGINEEIRPDMPYILMNLSGDPGNGKLHRDKMVEAVEIVFG
jgi:hypothetical protein